MEINTISKTSFSPDFLPGQPVKAFIGLKKRQWKQRPFLRQTIRDCLEGKGANVVDVQCYLKTGSAAKPQIDPSVINLFVRFNGQNSIVIV